MASPEVGVVLAMDAGVEVCVGVDGSFRVVIAGLDSTDVKTAAAETALSEVVDGMMVVGPKRTLEVEG